MCLSNIFRHSCHAFPLAMLTIPAPSYCLGGRVMPLVTGWQARLWRWWRGFLVCAHACRMNNKFFCVSSSVETKISVMGKSIQTLYDLFRSVFLASTFRQSRSSWKGQGCLRIEMIGLCHVYVCNSSRGWGCLLTKIFLLSDKNILSLPIDEIFWQKCKEERSIFWN